MSDRLNQEYELTKNGARNVQQKKYIQSMKLNGKWFTNKELRVCSDLFHLKIVVFSLINRTRFMDDVIKPS